MMKFLVVNNTLPTIFLKSLSSTSTSFVLFNKDFHRQVSPLFFFQSPECVFLHRGLSPTSSCAALRLRPGLRLRCGLFTPRTSPSPKSQFYNRKTLLSPLTRFQLILPVQSQKPPNFKVVILW